MLPPSNQIGPVRFAFIEMVSEDKVRFTFSTENIETRKLDEHDDLNQIKLPMHVEEVPLEIHSREGKDGIVLYKDAIEFPHSATREDSEGRVETVQRLRPRRRFARSRFTTSTIRNR